jgi:hypothetical protein
MDISYITHKTHKTYDIRHIIKQGIGSGIGDWGGGATVGSGDGVLAAAVLMWLGAINST